MYYEKLERNSPGPCCNSGISVLLFLEQRGPGPYGSLELQGRAQSPNR